ncbi:hypothetical protein EMCRGX_G022582 [Ephydatia muelleri]
MGRTQKSLRPGLFFMFGDRGKNYVVSESDSEGIEMTELNRKRKKPKRRKPKSPKEGTCKSPFVFIEEQVLPGDTLQRVALRYDCREADVRRANHLYNNQDFFALKTVKIPVRKHSVLTDPQELERRRKMGVEECVPSVRVKCHKEHMFNGHLNTSDDDGDTRSDQRIESDDGEGDDESGGDSDAPVITDISIQSALKWKHTRTALLTKFDEDLQRIRDELTTLHNNNSNLAGGGDVSLTLYPPQQVSPTDVSILARVLNVEAGWKLLSECDWRLIFFAVMFCIILISIVVILLFYKSHH